MAELIIVVFADSTHRASQVLDRLRVLEERWIAEMCDAVAIHREPCGLLKMDQSYQLTGRQGRGWGGVLGFLIGATLASPLTSGASVAVAAGAVTAASLTRTESRGSSHPDPTLWKSQVGIPETFVAEVTSLVGAGCSAVYALFEAKDTSSAVTRFKEYGGIVLQAALSQHYQQEIERLLRERQVR